MRKQRNIQQVFHIHPLQKVLTSFLGIIFLGTFLLMLPGMSTSTTGFTDALFTSTSAVCVTGLITLDTAAHFTMAGKTVILLLIQLGGLGIMTFSMGLLSMLGMHLSLKWRFTFSDLYGNYESIPARTIIRHILMFTLIIEGITSIILFFAFLRYFPPSRLWGMQFFTRYPLFAMRDFLLFQTVLSVLMVILLLF